VKWLFSSLYGRISAIFLVLLLVLSLTQLLVSVDSARNFSRESDQSLNRRLAADLAKTFQPALRSGLDREAMAHRIHDMMVYNPRVEIYLLDAEGGVLAYFSEQKPLERDRVALGPLRKFIAGGDAVLLPIFGDDPRTTDKRKPFSAAPIRIGAEPGYLYLILGGEQYESVASMVEESYIIRNSVISLVATFLLIGIAGLIIFFLLTKRVRAMAAAVRAFEHGDYSERVPEKSADEIGQLAKAFNDMAERVEANLEAITRSDNLRRELVANVSHDLRSPLASVQGYLETVLMKDALLTRGERARFLEIIHANVLRLSTLVNELFELSRLEARQIQPQQEPFALSELVQDVIVKFQPQALERHITLSSSFPHDLPFVAGDIAMIERVLSNLIDNALRYTPRQGTVRVMLEPGDGTVTVRVADTGYGIPAEDLPHVFDRFYRVDKSRSRDSGGSGIGLAIVKRILEMHESDVVVESTSPSGTVFAFALPAEQTSAPARGA
jgi:signal transduction histidine kinase